jgi:hypothetical protein
MLLPITREWIASRLMIGIASIGIPDGLADSEADSEADPE